MMKKILALMLAAVLVLTAACCLAENTKEAQKTAKAACNARMAELMPAGKKVPKPVMSFDDGEIPGCWYAVYSYKQNGLKTEKTLANDPAAGAVVMESTRVELKIKRGDAMDKAEKALTKAIPEDEEAEIPREAYEAYFAEFRTCLERVGLDADAYRWHIDAIMTDGTAVLLEGYGDAGCVLADVWSKGKNKHAVTLTWNNIPDSSFAENHPELQPGGFVCGME